MKGLKVFGDFSKQRVKKVGILAAKNGQFQELWSSRKQHFCLEVWGKTAGKSQWEWSKAEPEPPEWVNSITDP